MKSIIEEASSIAKAIDQAWQRAGKPKEFTVKIFEEPQRSMFGLTVRSAKIALLFDEKILSQAPYVPVKEKSHPTPKHTPQEKPAPIKKEEKKAPQQQQQAAPPKKSEPSPAPQPKKRKSAWTDQMVAFTQEWLNNSLKKAGIFDVAYDTEIIGNNLNIQFKNKLLENNQKERILFSSFAHLIMLTLSQSFKKRVPHLRIILKSSA